MPKKLFNDAAFDATLKSTDNSLALFRDTLQQGNESLLQRYENNENIETLVQENAWLIDQLLSHAWQNTFDRVEPQPSLIAVGGYGRGELHPGSDIDLLLLFAEDSIKSCKEKIESFLTMLWDIGLEVGQSVRTINDCVTEAEKDITVMTNLVESRFIAGNEPLFQQMLDATSPDKIWSSKAFFEAKLNEQQQRHLRYDDTAYKLEPNVKESPGGLRDIQTIGWVAKRYFGAKDLHELVAHDFLTEDEYNSLIQGQNLLWKIRFALHILTGRHEDRLLFDHQRTLALKFDFDDDGHNLAVEQFMQQYYRTVMELDRLNEMLLQLFQEAILYADDSPEPKPINRRFQSIKGFIEVTHDKVFEHAPHALLEIFMLLQIHSELKGIRASTIRLIRSSTDLINDKVRNDLRTKSLFMEIMRQPHGVTHELRRMNRYGVLAAYLPAFAHIVGRMQYDLFHTYTVDEHILFVVRNMRRFTVPEHHHEFPLCSKIIEHIGKPELLYLAGLYHDIAKGRGGDHSELGEEEAINLCQSHGLGEYDTSLVAWLVRNHLVMSTTAQRKDISDPEVIQTFADLVGDRTHLDYIYLLTVADIRATSPKMWNAWKDSLLKELYHSTLDALRKSSHELANHEMIIKSKQKDVHKLLEDLKVKTKEAETMWSNFYPEYFIRYSAEEIAWQTFTIIKHGKKAMPLVDVRYDKSRGSVAIFIYGPIKSHQFATTTATLEKSGLNIVDARIINSKNKYTLDTYLVLDQHNDNNFTTERLKEIKRTILETLTSENTKPAIINRRLSRHQKHFKVNTEISFSLDQYNNRTILEVITADRPGLLSRIGEAFRNCDIDLQNAKIATFGARIEDVFYITDNQGQPLDNEQFMQLRDELLSKLDN